ncbi:MAG: hypothetical protein M3O85_00740 [Acidobacteriota bacterium]|nr:hypothetical protein [Acidobacteriota bacterium]
MIHSLRTVFAVAAVLVCFSCAASADLKIKTRTTVMGHTTESTVYIKGARERREMSLGGYTATTITQCDQKRSVTISGDRCMVMQMGAGEASCPAAPGLGGEMPGSAPPRKGGTVTITRTVTDTGERQDMFGYKARHLKTSMTMEPSPDACNQSHMRMETDGWYADLSAAFSCSNESVPPMACGGMGRSAPRCSDRFVMKGGGGVARGYPLKLTTSITSDQGTFTTTTEVVELTNETVDAGLFDAPPSCGVADLPAGPGSPSAAPPAPAPSAPAEAAAPAPSAPAVLPKGAGTVRIGVVKLKDMSGQGLPTDNLRMNLMSEITVRKMEAVGLDADAPLADVVREARDKQCDYILYTTLRQVNEPGSGLPPALVPKGAKFDPANFQALTDMTLYKVSKPLPEIKELHLAADAAQLGINAVMATFEKESDKVAQQVAEDAHPKTAAKPAARRPVAKPK